MPIPGISLPMDKSKCHFTQCGRLFERCDLNYSIYIHTALPLDFATLPINKQNVFLHLLNQGWPL